MPNFDVTPTWVIPALDSYPVVITQADNFKREYNLLSNLSKRTYKLTFIGVTDADYANRVLGHYRSVSEGYAPFHWTTVPSYIDGGAGTGVSLYGRWVGKGQWKPRKTSWDIVLHFEVESRVSVAAVPAVPSWLIASEDGAILIAEDGGQIRSE